MLHPPSDRRERILAMGPFGTGKTTAWLNIALWAHKTGADMKFYATDTDHALEAFVDSETYGPLFESKRIVYRNAFEFPEYNAALDEFRAIIRPDDWLIGDFVSRAWDASQAYYIEEVFREGVPEFFLEARKAVKGGNPLDGWKDWSVINRLYKSYMNTLLHRTPGHKFLVAESENLRESDDKNIRAMFGAYGVRPKGQKELGYLPHTILYLQALKPGEIYMTTVKDRERPLFEGKVVKEFTVDYLVAAGGWKL